MKKLLIGLLALGSLTSFASSEEWDSKILTNTCSKELVEAINYVKESVNSRDELIAIMPKTIGYQYFNVVFKKVKNGVAVSNAFTYQFQYWTKNDSHKECTRVEPMDFIL